MDKTVNYQNTSDSVGDNAREVKPRSQESTEIKTGVIQCIVIVNSVCFIICYGFATVTKRGKI